MKLTSKIFRATIAVTAALFMTVSAFAQSTILVVDQNRILRESEVGKHITRQLETIAKSMESELKASSSPLQSEMQSLQSEMKALGSPDLLATRPDLQSRYTSLVGKSQKQQLEARYKQRELAKTEAVAFQKVTAQLENILKVIVAERNADVVFDRSVVIYGKPVDVTDTVLSRLNSQLRTVPVNRERLPRQ